MKKIFLIFILALVGNIIWENIHSLLYVSYKGGEITQFILVRASFFDAFLIAVIALPFLYITFFKKRVWLIFIIGVVIAILNEWYGLGTGRWIYNEMMPIIPLIETGLTPTLQLGLLGYVSFKIQNILLGLHTPKS